MHGKHRHTDHTTTRSKRRARNAPHVGVEKVIVDKQHVCPHVVITRVAKLRNAAAVTHHVDKQQDKPQHEVVRWCNSQETANEESNHIYTTGFGMLADQNVGDEKTAHDKKEINAKRAGQNEVKENRIWQGLKIRRLLSDVRECRQTNFEILPGCPWIETKDRYMYGKMQSTRWQMRASHKEPPHRYRFLEQKLP